MKGFDLSKPGKSSMSRRQGWPREQSLHNLNANIPMLNRLPALQTAMFVLPGMGVLVSAN